MDEGLTRVNTKIDDEFTSNSKLDMAVQYVAELDKKVTHLYQMEKPKRIVSQQVLRGPYAE